MSVFFGDKMKNKFSLNLIVLLFILVFVFASCSPDFFKSEQTTQEITGEFMTDRNGNSFPVYEDVETTQLQSENFLRNEDDRVYYADPTVRTFTGIDVSVFQGDIDWNKVKADGIDFVMIRAGFRGYGENGSLNEDVKFRENCKNALAAGLNVGVYFFSQAITEAEAAEEARFVLDIISDYNITYPVAYDWETIEYDVNARTENMSTEQITACANAFCDVIEKAGYETVIYFNCELGYFNYDLSKINNYHFWLAEYFSIPSFYYDYKIWQYTDKGQVDGIAGEVDINISLVDYASKGVVG